MIKKQYGGYVTLCVMSHDVSSFIDVTGFARVREPQGRIRRLRNKFTGL